MTSSDYWTVFQSGLVFTIGFGGLILIRKWVDKVNPDDRRHSPTRYTEAIAPFLVGAGVLGILLGLAGLLFDHL